MNSSLLREGSFSSPRGHLLETLWMGRELLRRFFLTGARSRYWLSKCMCVVLLWNSQAPRSSCINRRCAMSRLSQVVVCRVLLLSFYPPSCWYSSDLWSVMISVAVANTPLLPVVSGTWAALWSISAWWKNNHQESSGSWGRRGVLEEESKCEPIEYIGKKV